MREAPVNFLAKIGADTAEIELNFAEMLPIGRPWREKAGCAWAPPGPRAAGPSRAGRLASLQPVGFLPTNPGLRIRFKSFFEFLTVFQPKSKQIIIVAKCWQI